MVKTHHDLYYNVLSLPDLEIATAVSYHVRFSVKDLCSRLYAFDGLGVKPSFAEGSVSPKDIAHIQEILCE